MNKDETLKFLDYFKFKLIKEYKLELLYKLLIIRSEIKRYHNNYLLYVNEKNKNRSNKELKEFVEKKYKELSNILQIDISEKIEKNENLMFKYFLMINYGGYCPYYNNDSSPQEEILKNVNEFGIIVFNNIHK